MRNTSILDLPVELVSVVLGRLDDFRDVVRLGRVSRDWHEAASSETLWRELYMRHLGITETIDSSGTDVSWLERFKEDYGVPKWDPQFTSSKVAHTLLRVGHKGRTLRKISEPTWMVVVRAVKAIEPGEVRCWGVRIDSMVEGDQSYTGDIDVGVACHEYPFQQDWLRLAANPPGPRSAFYVKQTHGLLPGHVVICCVEARKRGRIRIGIRGGPLLVDDPYVDGMAPMWPAAAVRSDKIQLTFVPASPAELSKKPLAASVPASAPAGPMAPLLVRRPRSTFPVPSETSDDEQE